MGLVDTERYYEQILIFDAPAAPADQKVTAKCAEAMRHRALTSQAIDVYSYSSRK